MHSHIHKRDCTCKQRWENCINRLQENSHQTVEVSTIWNHPIIRKKANTTYQCITTRLSMSDTLNVLNRRMERPTKTTLLNAIRKKFNMAFLHREQRCQVSTRFNTHSTGASRPNTGKLSVYSTTNIQNNRKWVHQYLRIHQPGICAHREDIIRPNRTIYYPIKQ